MKHLVFYEFPNKSDRELMRLTFDGLSREDHSPINIAGHFSAYLKGFIGAFTVS